MTSRNWVVMAGAVALLWPTVAAAGPQEKATAQAIAQQVKQSGQLSNYRLGVSCNEGVATLSGEVSDASQAQAAVQLARSVSGVEKVVNRLKIKSSAPQNVEVSQEKSGGLLMSLTEAVRKPRVASKATPQRAPQQPQLRPTNNMPRAMGPSQMAGVNPAAFQQQRIQQAQMQQAQCSGCNSGYGGGYAGGGGAGGGVGHENANMPGYAWPSYAAHPNYAALSYPKQYSPTAWPYIGPFYPYPQVPLGWRKVSLEWDDGWWFLDFSHHQCQ